MDPPAINVCTSAAEILKFQWLVRQVPMSAEMARKAVDVVRATRPSDPTAGDDVKKYARYGASIRATQFLALAAKARALSSGRYHVTDRGPARAGAAGAAPSRAHQLPGRVRWRHHRLDADRRDRYGADRMNAPATCCSVAASG